MFNYQSAKIATSSITAAKVVYFASLISVFICFIRDYRGVPNMEKSKQFHQIRTYVNINIYVQLFTVNKCTFVVRHHRAQLCHKFNSSFNIVPNVLYQKHLRPQTLSEKEKTIVINVYCFFRRENPKNAKEEIVERTAAATTISKSTVYRIKSERKNEANQNHAQGNFFSVYVFFIFKRINKITITKQIIFIKRNYSKNHLKYSN